MTPEEEVSFQLNTLIETLDSIDAINLPPESSARLISLCRIAEAKIKAKFTAIPMNSSIC